MTYESGNNALLLSGVFLATHFAWEFSPSPTGLTCAVLAGVFLHELNLESLFSGDDYHRSG